MKTRGMLLALLLGTAFTVALAPAAEPPTPVMARSSLEAPPKPPPPEKPGYNTEYFFVTTRSVADSTLVTALKPPLFLLTIPVDVALLPVAAIAGFF